jgi:hypothetical protein
MRMVRKPQINSPCVPTGEEAGQPIGRDVGFGLETKRQVKGAQRQRNMRVSNGIDSAGQSSSFSSGLHGLNSLVAREWARAWAGAIEMATEKEIQNYAYKLWQQAGCPKGQDDKFWHQAKAELATDPDAANPPLPKTK